MIREFYERAGGDYAAALQAFRTEERVRRYLCRFPEDSSYADLNRALEREDTEEAFRAAHSLKGVALTLRLTALYEAAAEVTEALRHADGVRACALMQALTAAYARTLEAVGELARADG